jgi:hypothetical protein
MPAQYTRADALREYLTGASSDGGSQNDPTMCLGDYRSSTEAVSLGIAIYNALTNVQVLYASGANPIGNGTLTAVDTNTLTWQPPGALTPGTYANFSGTNVVGIVEGPVPGQYLRVKVTTPLTPGQSTIALSILYDNFFGFNDVDIADAAAGISEYRASIIRNESAGSVTGFQRWLDVLGTQQISDGGQLGSSGSGTITTSGSLADWPEAGWCQVRDNTGTLRETVYYTTRTNTILTVPSAGRSLLGTSAQAGAVTDTIYPTPGIAIALEPGGSQVFGSTIQVIADANTAPASVTWNQELTAAGGLQIGTVAAGYQVGVWIWRQVPPGAIATPQNPIELLDYFLAF